jgi:hypothetical protein
VASQGTPSTTNKVFPNFKNWSSANHGAETQQFSTDPTLANANQFSDQAASYALARYPSYRSPSGLGASLNSSYHTIPLGSYTHHSLPGQPVNFQNLELARKISLKQDPLSKALPSSIKPASVITPDDDINENKVEEGVCEVLSQEQNGANSTASLPSKDKNDDDIMKN